MLGEVFRSGLSHGAGAGLSTALSGGQAQAVLARTPALAPVVHRAFSGGLDLAYVVAAGFGLIAAVAVFALVRPKSQSPAAPASAPASAPAAEPAAASAEA